MPLFNSHSRRYNTLRLLGYDYRSIAKLCALTLVTHQRRPLFADVKLAKMVLACLLSNDVLRHLRLRAFTLMPDHLHLIGGGQDFTNSIPSLIGSFKSYTTQAYWRRSREIVESNQVCLPSTDVNKSDPVASRVVISSLLEWSATLRPEIVELKNWPSVKPGHFLKKQLWQTRFFDHVIRNGADLEDNLDYIAMNSVRAGYVIHPQFYPFTGFLR